MAFHLVLSPHSRVCGAVALLFEFSQAMEHANCKAAFVGAAIREDLGTFSIRLVVLEVAFVD